MQNSDSVDHVLSPFCSASDLSWTSSPLILLHCLSPLSLPWPGVQEPPTSTHACHGALLALPHPHLMAVWEGSSIFVHEGLSLALSESYTVHCSRFMSSINGSKKQSTPMSLRGPGLSIAGLLVDPLLFVRKERKAVECCQPREIHLTKYFLSVWQAVTSVGFSTSQYCFN